MISKEQLIEKYRNTASEKMQPLVNQMVELIATAFETGLELGLSIGEEFIDEYTKGKKLEN